MDSGVQDNKASSTILVLQAVDGPDFRLEAETFLPAGLLSPTQLASLQHLGILSYPGATSPANPPIEPGSDDLLAAKANRLTRVVNAKDHPAVVPLPTTPSPVAK